ncbi:hypothetical protein PENTCL1PPCAC_14787, partial [Pristionchus entomophagus]
LGIYAVYVVIVIFTEYFKKKRKVTTADISKRNSVIRVDHAIHEIVKETARVVNGTARADEPPRRDSTFKRLSIAVASVVMGHDNEIFVEDPENDVDDFVVLHNTVYHGEHARSRAATLRHSIPPSHGIFSDLLHFFAPEKVTSTFGKIKAYIFWPIVTIFKLTIPKSDARWSKPLAIIHAVLGPQCLLFTTHLSLFAPIAGGPGLYAYVPIISLAIIVFILCVTSVNEEPRFYEVTYSLAGFIMSIGWIYCISTEVVEVVEMLGVVSGIDQAVLGLTIIAWANEVGDLVADTSVARQGFPRMAMAAAIGGPLFNQLIGFGLPFTIAKLKGDTVPISLSGVNVIM